MELVEVFEKSHLKVTGMKVLGLTGTGYGSVFVVYAHEHIAH